MMAAAKHHISNETVKNDYMSLIELTQGAQGDQRVVAHLYYVVID